MSNRNLKIYGWIGLALCGVLLFVAWERYSTNVQSVEAANRMLQSSPLGDAMGEMMQQFTGQSELKPTVPAATIYSLLFAAISGIAGIACLVASSKK